jgi:tyrosinase
VNQVLVLVPYDKDPWNLYLGSFRANLETEIHNTAHDWVGGSLATPCSPNDPVFWLHHCNIDRLWAEWQLQHFGWPYLPPSGTPGVLGLDDAMMLARAGGFKPTPRCVLNHAALGYRYDTEPPLLPARAAISWQNGSSIRTYVAGNPDAGSKSYVIENRYDVGGKTEGDLVSAITWGDNGDNGRVPSRKWWK